VFGFEEGSAQMRDLLGNKGDLAEMTSVLGADMMPGGQCQNIRKPAFPSGLLESRGDWI
jgi:hypothetical protein